MVWSAHQNASQTVSNVSGSTIRWTIPKTTTVLSQITAIRRAA